MPTVLTCSAGTGPETLALFDASFWVVFTPGYLNFFLQNNFSIECQRQNHPHITYMVQTLNM